MFSEQRQLQHIRQVAAAVAGTDLYQIKREDIVLPYVYLLCFLLNPCCFLALVDFFCTENPNVPSFLPSA
jgi:hypothetical protein